MKAELRVAFAMGGGVSLGAYSGAALTEALKWMIVEAAQDGSHYDRVVVDAFSGSSAGSMALVLFLRALAAPDSLEIEGFGDPEKRLKEQFGHLFDAFDESRNAHLKPALLAAQKAQDLQEYVWVRAPEIDLRHLLGVGSDRDLRHEAGLLDRGAVEAIARDWLELPKGETFDDRQILADRVLFAATLGRLTPLIADARTELGPVPEEEDFEWGAPGPPTDPRDLRTAALARAGFKAQGLVDGLTSKLHRDLRIFDLNFEPVNADEQANHPARWLRYHNRSGAPEHPDPERFAALGHQRTWATLGATAIASGAFPLAFSPVVLRRFRFEYGPFWPQELGKADDFLFTYVDGGTFNNEPIREAMRLASHLDAFPPRCRRFSRRILFVDPLVNDLKIDYRLGVFQENLLEKPDRTGQRLDGFDLRRRTTLDRLLPQTGSVASAIFSEARRIDADEQFVLDQRLQCRQKLHDILKTALAPDPAGKTRAQLEAFCTDLLQQERQDLTFPHGASGLEKEIERVQVTGPDPVMPVDMAADADAPEAAEPVPAEPVSPEKKYLDSLLEVALDLAMGLDGRRKHTALVGIAPFRLTDGCRYELPAEAIQGFAGFASLPAREHAAALGRHCALESLATCDLLPASNGREVGDPPATPDASEIREDLEAALKDINRRLEEVIETSHLINVLPILDTQILSLLSSIVTGQTDSLLEVSPDSTSYEIRVKVPADDNTFRLQETKSSKKQKPSVPAGETEPHLVTFAQWIEGEKQGGQTSEGRWEGPHVENGEIRVSWIRRGDVGPGTLHLQLPDQALREKANLLPYPVFRQTLIRQQSLVMGDGWEVYNPLRSLDEELFREDS